MPLTFPLAIAAALCLVSAACGGAPASPQGPGAAEPADTTTPAESTSPAQPVTEADCARFLDNVIAIGVADSQDDNLEVPPTDDDAEAIRKKYREDNMEECLGYPRTLIDCGTKAKTRKDLEGC